MTNKTKTFACFFLLIGIVNSVNAQAFYTRQIGKIVFNGSTADKDSVCKKSYAELCNSYINRFYHNKKLPLIYLAISSKVNESSYELAFDNLNGNSLKNKLYNRKGKYDIPGIRIKIYSQNKQPEVLLKLLDYAISNLSTLKLIRKRASKADYYDQPETLSISSGKIDSIVNAKTKIEIVGQLSSYHP